MMWKQKLICLMNPVEHGKLFGLLPFIAESLISGTVLVIDELDAKIHPVLLRHIIMMFNDMRYQ